MEQNLINDDLIRQLCAVHDEALSKQKQTSESTQQLSNGTEENRTEADKSQTTWFTNLGIYHLNGARKKYLILYIRLRLLLPVRTFICLN